MIVIPYTLPFKYFDPSGPKKGGDICFFLEKQILVEKYFCVFSCAFINAVIG